MYEVYWGLKCKPFENTPNPTFFFNSACFEEVVSRLLYTATNNKGLCLITGEIGCGKTTASRYFVSILPKERFKIALIENPSLDSYDLLKEIVYLIGGEPGHGTKHDLLKSLNSILYREHLAGKQCVLIIDEAQIMPKESFEEVRLLLNFQLPDRYLLNIVLLGQPELRSIIDDIPQLAQRISIRYHLERLNEWDTKSYIQYRQKVGGLPSDVFSAEAHHEIYALTQGNPRLINTLCDLSLLIGYGLKIREIDREAVTKAHMTFTE